MATLPRSRISVDPTVAVSASGDELICVVAPVALNPDITPRLFGSASAVAAQHGYADGVEYVGLHTDGTGLPVLFIGVPIGTAGVVGAFQTSGNTGSSTVSVAAGGDGVLAEHDGVLRCTTGGTVGTDQIKLELSLDGGRSFRPVRLGVASSYVVPNVNVTASFGAGTLVTGDTLCTWHGSSPLPSTSDFPAARAALAASSKRPRSLLFIGDLPNSAAASAVVTEVNAYASANDRCAYAAASLGDRLPQATLGDALARVTGAPALTFAEVGASGDTVTRSGGSWLSEGFRNGDTLTVVGSASNNVVGVATGFTDLVATMGTTDLAAEVTAAATVTGQPTLTFDSTAHTVSRNRGSWLDDGFRVGMSVTITGTASNNVTKTITVLTGLVMTFAAGLVTEVIGANAVVVTSGQTKAAWMAALDSSFAAIDAQPRIDLGAGRGSVFSSYSGTFLRRSVAWAAAIREYQHDLCVAPWRTDLGPTGWDLTDANGNLVEWDDRADGGAGSAARFTTFRTYANGVSGAFITLALTRAGDGQLLSLTHNAAVVNLACNSVQGTAERAAIGRALQLKPDGTATKEALAVVARIVNEQLGLDVLTSHGDGPRSSFAVWAPDPNDVYTVSEPVMHGTLDIELNGTVHSIATSARIQTGAQ